MKHHANFLILHWEGDALAWMSKARTKAGATRSARYHAGFSELSNNVARASGRPEVGHYTVILDIAELKRLSMEKRPGPFLMSVSGKLQ